MTGERRDTDAPRSPFEAPSRRPLRRLIAASPWLYCTAARARRGRNRTIVNRHSDVLVEGFPRSGNTYVVAWLALAQPSRRVASHVHHLAHVRRAQKLGVPALIVMRRPRDAVLSNLVFHPGAEARRLVAEWTDFYDEAVLTRAGTVVATFDDVTGDLPRVLERFARRTGLDLRTDAPPTDEAVFELVQELGDRRFGEVPDTRVSRPTAARTVEQEQAARALDDPALIPLLRDADARYVDLATERPGR